MTDEKWENALSLLHVATAGILFIGLLTTWYKCCIENTHVIHPHVSILSVLAISMFCASSFGIAIYYANLISSFEVYTIIDVWEFFQAFGHAFTYLLFIKRVRVTFSGTKYQYPPFIYGILYSLIILFVSIQFVHIVINYVFWYDLSHDKALVVSQSQYELTLKVVIWSTAVIDFTLTVLFLTLVFRKLMQLTYDIGFGFMDERGKLTWAVSVSIRRNSKDTISIGKMSLNDNQTRIINAIAKITVLSFFSVASAQILIIWLGYMYTTHELSSFNYWMCYVPVRSLSNMCCIILSFEFMDDRYLQICGICDECCAILCEGVTKRSLKRTVKDELRGTLLSHQQQL